MKRKKHKRKVNRIIIFTSDAANYKTKQIKVHPVLYVLVILFFCVMVGALVGVAMYGSSFMAKVQDNTKALQGTITDLTEENTLLQSENAELMEKVTILSETINQKVLEEQELEAKKVEESLPTEFPLTGSVTVEEVDEPEPICIFTASEGTTVISAATGIVTAIEDDADYGKKVIIDHGNGYQTIYRNQGEVKVKMEEEIARGATIFVISDDNTKVGYQMIKDGNYISPMEVIEING